MRKNIQFSSQFIGKWKYNANKMLHVIFCAFSFTEFQLMFELSSSLVGTRNNGYGSVRISDDVQNWCDSAHFVRRTLTMKANALEFCFFFFVSHEYLPISVSENNFLNKQTKYVKIRHFHFLLQLQNRTKTNDNKRFYFFYMIYQIISG